MDNQNNEPKKYKMTIGLSVLEHLGIGLYSNVPAVLSEVVANAWDADAENVCISINPNRREIVISDDGSGMTESDINEKYLKVGYKKRESEPNQGITPKFGRPPMGRKGIGKLSLFSIAEKIEIHTVKDGEKNAFRMSSRDIQKTASQTGEDYHPEPLGNELVQIEQGTSIKLTALKKRIDRVDEFLRKRLARRFSIIGKGNFNVSIDGEFISPKDRDYYKHIQFLWYFGEENENEELKNAKRSVSICEIVDQEKGYQISGWIGTVESTVKKRNQINEDTNSIVIFANGKLVHENMLKDMKEGGVWTKYIMGEIDADYMDDSNEEDIITSARQSLNEDDERYKQLKEFLQNGVIRHIAANWQKWRNESGGEKVLRERKHIKRWYDQLKGDQKDSAKKLLGKIEALEVSEADKKEFYKALVLAFERLSITHQLSILNSLETEKDFERISKIFGELTELERALYYDIAKSRVEIIKKLEKIIDEDKKERVIQELIFKALWLLDPSWERAATNSRMEETVTKEFENVKGLSDEDRRARIDIRYQTVTGKHVIIELKRYSASIDIFTLLPQISKYKSALQKCLKSFSNEYENMPVEIICITGTRSRTKTVEDHLRVAGAKWLTYDELIENARNSYQEYLKAEERISELASIIDSLDEDFDTE